MVIYYKRIIIKLVFILILLFVFTGINYCYADDPLKLKDAFDPASGKPLNTAAVQGGGFNAGATFEGIIGKIITMAIGLIGVIFLILAIYGGYMWMTAHGNDETVEKAKKTIVSAIIGLIIVLAAYAISHYLVSTIGAEVFKDVGPAAE